MLKPALITILFTLAYHLAVGQQNIVDSLKDLLPNVVDNEEKILLLGNLAYYTSQLNPEEGLKYATELINYAEDLDHQQGLANGHYKKAVALMNLGRYSEAFVAAEDAGLICEQIQDTQRLLFCLDLLGIINTYAGNFEGAIAHLFRGATLAEASGDNERAGSIYNNIGELYFKSKDEINAKKYFERALPFVERVNDRLSLPTIYINLSLVEENDEKRKNLIKNAINICQKDNYHRGLAYAYPALAEFWLNKDQNDSALYYYEKAVVEAELGGESYVMIENLIHLATLEIEDNKLDQARSNLEKGMKMANQQNQFDQIKKIQEQMTLVSLQTGNYQQAYHHLDEAKQLGDSIYTTSLSEQAARADAAYESSIKEAQLLEQQLQIARQRNRFNQTLILGGFILIVIISIYQYRRQKDQKDKHQAEIKLEKEKAISESLKSLDQLKTTFFNNIAHELRTPLTLIKGPLERLDTQTAGTSFHKDIIRAHQNSGKLLDLVNEIMDLSKIESGNLTLNEELTSIEDFLNRTFYAFESHAHLNNVKLHFFSELDSEVSIRIDSEKLEKIINNLVSNAIRHDPGGNVSMSAKIFDSVLSISISDQGSGIHPDDKPYVFDRFFQSGRPEKESIGGAGIGLSIAKEYAELMSGKISLQSDLEKGTIFTLLFPVRPVIQKNANKIKASTLKPLTTNAKNVPLPTILIVEDHAGMQNYLESLLDNDYHCVLADDGAKALQILQKQRIDLILSDIMMPIMDGLSLRQKLNENEKFNHIPFIFISAKSLEENILQGLRLGVDVYH